MDEQKPEAASEGSIGQSASTGGLERLLPCPFCGAGENRIISQGAMWPDGKSWRVTVRHWCQRADKKSIMVIDFTGVDEEAAISEWNRRSNG